MTKKKTKILLRKILLVSIFHVLFFTGFYLFNSTFNYLVGQYLEYFTSNLMQTAVKLQFIVAVILLFILVPLFWYSVVKFFMYLQIHKIKKFPAFFWLNVRCTVITLFIAWLWLFILGGVKEKYLVLSATITLVLMMLLFNYFYNTVHIMYLANKKEPIRTAINKATKHRGLLLRLFAINLAMVGIYVLFFVVYGSIYQKAIVVPRATQLAQTALTSTMGFNAVQFYNLTFQIGAGLLILVILAFNTMYFINSIKKFIR